MKLFLPLLLLLASPVTAITLNGNTLAYRSTGTSSGSAWVIDRNGYLGTYVTLAAPGAVSVAVNANGTPSGGVAPRMNVVIGDSASGFDVASGDSNYGANFTLPAGTHFIRTEFTNDLALTARQLKVNNITITGGTVSNTASNTNALAAADSYIANYRKGHVSIGLAGLGLPAGTPVQVNLKKLDFAWGTVVPGSNSGVNSYLGTGTTKQTNYKAKVLQNFNALGTENAGKWNDTESSRGNPTMAGVDTILNFAQANNLTTRLHTLAYDLDQNDPSWVNTLRSQAVNSASAKTDLRNAISSRIDYYLPPSRAAKVGAVDVFNESYQSECCRGNSSYMSLFGASGVASVFNELQQDLGSAQTKLYVNEYNALIYANGNAAGYFPHIENLQRAGAAIDGIGTQHYPWSLSMHSPSDILKAMQTYNVTGLPQTITELGAFSDNGLTDSQAATVLGDVMRLAFGNPNSEGAYLWGFHRENGGGNLFAPGLALYDVNTSNWNNWTITPAGKVWQDKLGIADWDGNSNNDWDTELTLPISNGAIEFDGYYGDYEITVGGQTYDLSLVRGESNYQLGSIAGDFNFDGRVDARDYVQWRNMGGTPAEYAVWRSNFGASSLPGVAVPEPATIWLLLVLLVVSLAITGWLSRRRA